nr:hypothetical protein GCM10020093_013970 [Planobispora longispora]
MVRSLDAEMAAMLTRGFTPVLALRTITTLSHYVLGFVLQEQAAAPAGGSSLGPLISILDDGAEAPLVAALEHGSSERWGANFDHGIRTIIAGTSPPGPP